MRRFSMSHQDDQNSLLSIIEDLAARWSEDLAELAALARELRREASARRNHAEAWRRRRRREQGPRP